MGFTIMRKARAENLSRMEQYGRVSFAEEGEDMVMREFFEDMHAIKNGFYVDIGAHHPWRISNTAYYYQKGWRGINVEPNPVGYQLFLKERPEDINLNVGVADKKGELNFYYYGEYSGNNTFSEKFNERMLRRNIHPQKVLRIPVIDINEVLNHANGREIDFLSIDVESFELPILRQMDFITYRPKMILVELLHTTLENIQLNPVYQLLISKNYRLYAHTMRTFFFKKNDMEKHRAEPDLTVKFHDE